MRQIVLDTETTGLETERGHRVIEIGAVEIVNRRLTGRHFHQYLNPEREIDDGAREVHGISLGDLLDKPKFAEIADEFFAFIDGAELVIHNAAFDITFLDYEIELLDTRTPQIEQRCRVVDSLELARNKHPGQRNNLDALCRRYEIDNSSRVLHGALLDAEILADVYLLMTGGQTALFGGDAEDGREEESSLPELNLASLRLPVVEASKEDEQAHREFLDFLDDQSDGAVWRTVA